MPALPLLFFFMSYAVETDLTPRPPPRRRGGVISPPLRGGGEVGRGGVSAAAKKFNCVTPNFIQKLPRINTDSLYFCRNRNPRFFNSVIFFNKSNRLKT